MVMLLGGWSLLGLTGCASIATSSHQTLHIKTVDENNNIVYGANCSVSNDKGDWFVKTPGHVKVQKSSQTLRINCKKSGYRPTLKKVGSTLDGAFYGNIICGGPVGMVVDHCTEKGYGYPEEIVIMMKEAFYNN